MTQPYPITAERFAVQVNGFRHRGAIWEAWPLEIDPTDASALAVAYRARHAGGTRKVRIRALTGVRYARTDRWRPATKVAPSADVDCLSWPPIAPQAFRGEGRPGAYRDEWRDEVATDYASFGTREGEDCHFVNIYWPDGEPPVGGWPIALWQHGGGGNFLSPSQPVLRAQRLAAEGLMVMVFGYRLGTLGSFHHPDIPGEAGYQGLNFALTDAMAMLRWVQDHARDLGGDPSRVTFGGSSFGGNATLCLMAHPVARELFAQAYCSSPSGGVQKRWAPAMTPGLVAANSYARWHEVRHVIITAMARWWRDARNTARSLRDAIAERGYLTAIRENLSLGDFQSMDGGGTNLSVTFQDWQPGQHYLPGGPLLRMEGEIYEVEVEHTSSNIVADLEAGYLSIWEAPEQETSRSLTVLMDGVSVLHPTNRAAALAGAFAGWAKPLMIGVAQQESSAIGFGRRDHPWDREARDLANWTVAEWLATSGSLVDTNYNGAASTWSDIERNRMLFNFGYASAALAVAEAVEAAGGTPYLQFGNYVSFSRGRLLCGHAWDVAYIFGNPHYAADPGELKAADVRVSDGMVKAFVQFCWTGNPNSTVDTGRTLGLFADPWGQTYAPFQKALGNWNVIGSSPFRSAASCTPDITTRNAFWKHAFDIIKARIGA